MCPKSRKGLGLTENKENFYVRVTSKNEQLTVLTVMATFSAVGKCIPPMIIFFYKRVPQAKCIPNRKIFGNIEENGNVTNDKQKT